MYIASYVLFQISNVVAEAIQSDDDDGLDQNVAEILREAGAPPKDWERLLKDAFIYILEMRFDDGSILTDYAFPTSEAERLRKFVLSRPEDVFKNGEIDEDAWDEWETNVESMDLYDPLMDEIFLVAPDKTEIKILRQSCYDALAELYCLPDPERKQSEDEEDE